MADHEIQSQEPLTLFQQSLVELADRLNAQGQSSQEPKAGKTITEHEAGSHIHNLILHYMGSA